MINIKISLMSFMKAIYGELFNKKIPLIRRFKRIFARFNLSNVFIFFIKFFGRNNEIKTSPTIFKKLNHSKAIQNLKEHGIFDELFLPEKETNQILEFCKITKFNFNRDENYKINFSERLNQKNLYIMNINNPHLNCETINKITHDQQIILLIKDYFGINPLIDSTQIFWSIPCFDNNGNIIKPPNNEFGYHYDIDGFKFLKLFFYLTDVNNDKDGSHVFIKKNKQNKQFIKSIHRRVSDDFVEQNYSDRIFKVIGKKGKGFLEDTSNYHKGNFPYNERGILSIVYNISNW